MHGRLRHRRPRDDAYWAEIARLVMDYFELQAGARFSATLLDGFFKWLKSSPAEGQRYMEGDDMARARLVDLYLKIVW